jgi:DnaJ-class molecular chaperone
MEAHKILGVQDNASEAEIRAAWLMKVKEFPPDRSPVEFERIRDAYDSLRDPRVRARAMLFSTAFSAPLHSLFEKTIAARSFLGPHAWREVLKTK